MATSQHQLRRRIGSLHKSGTPEGGTLACLLLELSPYLLGPRFLARPVHEVKAFGKWLGDDGWAEGSATQSVWASPIPPAVSSHFQPSYSSPHSSFSPDWSLIPGFCGPQLPCTSPRVWSWEKLCPGLQAVPSPTFSQHPSPGAGLDTKTGSFHQPHPPPSHPFTPPTPPAALPLPGLAEAKENRALPLTLPLSLTSCPGKMVDSLPPPWALAQDLAMVSSFSRASRIRGPAWAHAGPFTSLHFTLFVCLFFLDPGPVPLFPCSKIL